jgi:hypothetical protein
MNKPPATLANALIAKSILETLLVGTLAVAVYLNAFPPTFHGWGEAVIESQTISGWAVNDASPWERVHVQLFVDENLIGTQVANLSRPDVQAAGWSRDEWHGYSFAVTGLAPGPHEARVYALHPSSNGARFTLQILGDPVRFEIQVNGVWRLR